MSSPRLSVVIPAYQCDGTLHGALAALRASDLPRELWELIVVDDGSEDSTAAVAREWTHRVVRVEGGPRGPAHARNRGSEEATGEILVFVDSDVVVHPDALGRFNELFAARPDVVAAFGAYDDAPADPALLSQYRNLLHRYVHLRGAGEAETFWAGCGAVRAAAFRAVGGFDSKRFPRPQIEDIELGYRLRDLGGHIVLDPGIQGSHLKRWTLGGIVRTDLFDRGIPWMRLLIARRRSRRGRGATLNVKPLEKIKTGLLGLGLVGLVVAASTGSPAWAWAGTLLIGAVVALNLPLYVWFAGLRGWRFTLLVVPLSLLYYLLSGLSVTLAWGSVVLGKGPADPRSADRVEAR